MWCHLQISSYRIDLMLMVQYLQNNVIMKWTTRFTGWIPLKYGSTTTPPIIAHCKKNSDVKPRISHCDSPNLQYKTHPEFWPSHRRIFKTSLYYKTRLILETRRYLFWVANQSRFVVFYALKPSNTSLITKTFILLSSTCNSNTCSSSLPVPVVPKESTRVSTGSQWVPPE